jgi:dimethylaniline monooxygenase (N-oxide forming)
MFDGLWRNERGSEMSLICRDGKVSGFYTTRVGDKRVTERRTALVGAFAGETIGFVVAWPETGSVTSWAGRYHKEDENGLETIHTLWHLVNETVGGDTPRPSDPWESFRTQASIFRKQHVPSENGPGERSMSRTVAIIGAGISGLSAAKAALEEGLKPTVFDAADVAGGLWRPGSGFIWDSMRTNLSKWTCMLSDFPWSPEAADFPRGDLVAKYLQDYARAEDIERVFRLGCRVVEVRQAPSGWIVETDDGAETRFDAVIAATGVFAKPFVPPLPGSGDFNGPAYHSSSYRRPSSGDHKIAIVGAAFSGIEIAAHLADRGRQVYILFGHPPWIVPRFYTKDGHEIPLDLVLYHRKSPDPEDGDPDEAVQYERTAEFFERTFGNPGGAHPDLEVPTKGIAPYVAISDTFLDHVRERSIVPVNSRLASIEPDGILTDDGRKIEVGEIIYCTGYESDLSYLHEDVRSKIEYDASDKLIPFVADRTVHHPDLPGLYFVGLYRGPFFAVVELQARWAAMMISERLAKPDPEVSARNIAEERRLRQVSPRPQFPHGNYVEFADSIAAEIGALPTEATVAPPLREAIREGAVVPSQYRLVGPHADPDVAGPVIEQALARTRP